MSPALRYEPDPLAGQARPVVNNAAGYGLPFTYPIGGNTAAAPVILDPTWSTYHVEILFGLFAPPSTPGDIELDWTLNEYAVGDAFGPGAAGSAVIPEADLVPGKLLEARLLSNVPVSPGAVTSLVDLDRTAGPADTAVCAPGTFAVFAVVYQRAS